MNRLSHPILGFLAFAALVALLAGSAQAQVRGAQPPAAEAQEGLVNLDFNDVELTVVIDTIARMTGKNFIYDDRVRGRVTILSPGQVTVDQAYAVFESVLKVKGFTAVPGPADVLKIIPIRDAKESNIDTVKDSQPSANRDLFVTRLIPLLYIDATEITNTIKPLVSKDASIIAYAPTNMIILTDTASNIRRLLSILESIDVKTHKEELAVIKIEYADAEVLGEQISEIYGAEVQGSTSRRRVSTRSSAARRTTTTPTTPPANGGARSRVRIITDERTNSLLVLAARAQLEDVRQLVRQLDVPVVTGGRIHVYYLKHSDAEELAQTLNGLLTGQTRSAATPGRTGAAGAQPQAIRSAVSELAEGISLTADPATNSLVIQASKEAYETLLRVIKALDIPRPQVLVEALIMEVDITDSMDLGVEATYKIVNGDSAFIFNTGAAAIDSIFLGGGGSAASAAAAGIFKGLVDIENGEVTDDSDKSEINAIITATASDGRFNVLSAPHILTSDNEEAEIKIGDNIPIVTSRVQSAAGVDTGLATSQNIERQDIGVTLRVTPQISEGDTLRLKIYQEIKEVNEQLNQSAGFDSNESGTALRQRTIDNSVVVQDGETVVIGGLISEITETSTTKVPFLGDVPFFGWAFRTDSDGLRKVNLLVFLTPHIVRDGADMAAASIRKRRELMEYADASPDADPSYLEQTTNDPQTAVQRELRGLMDRYPYERLAEITQARADAAAEREHALATGAAQRRFEIVAGEFRSEEDAAAQLTRLLDMGFEAMLLSGTTDGIIVHELRVGPYAELEQADRIAEILRDSYGLDSSIIVINGSPPESADEAMESMVE